MTYFMTGRFQASVDENFLLGVPELNLARHKQLIVIFHQGRCLHLCIALVNSKDKGSLVLILTVERFKVVL